MSHHKQIEVIFTPELYRFYNSDEAIVVVIDIFRATTAICTAIENGVEHIIPVPSLKEAEEFKKQGYIVAAERDGNIPDFADFGNSPFNFTPERVKDKKVAYSTTNGAKTIRMAANSQQVIIGSFVNISAVAEHLMNMNENVLLLCAGWKGKFCLEDTIMAGALSEKLLDSKVFTSDCDSLKASLDLWSLAKPNIIQYIDKAMQRKRLHRLGLDDILEYAHTPDSSDRIPCFKNGKILDYHES